jgi:hypothetical protein
MQMTDEQVMTIAVAIVIPVSLLLYSNSRITDVRTQITSQITDTKETLRAEIKILELTLGGNIKALELKLDNYQTEMRADMKLLREEMGRGFDRMEAALRQHILEYHK